MNDDIQRFRCDLLALDLRSRPLTHRSPGPENRRSCHTTTRLQHAIQSAIVDYSVVGRLYCNTIQASLPTLDLQALDRTGHLIDFDLDVALKSRGSLITVGCQTLVQRCHPNAAVSASRV